MLIPRHWAKAKDILHIPASAGSRAKKHVYTRWGWSQISHEDAENHARTRLCEAMIHGRTNQKRVAQENTKQNKEIQEGTTARETKQSRQESKSAYNGADGVPIREEILEENHQCVITRNSYGAHCLNVPDVLILDVDSKGLQWPEFHAVLLGIASSILLTAWLGYNGTISLLNCVVLAVFLMWGLSFL